MSGDTCFHRLAFKHHRAGKIASCSGREHTIHGCIARGGFEMLSLFIGHHGSFSLVVVGANISFLSAHRIVGRLGLSYFVM